MKSSKLLCLRKVVNKTRRDKIRNEVIRDMAGAKPVLQHIRQQQVKWFGHITRMPLNQPALRAYNNNNNNNIIIIIIIMSVFLERFSM